MKAPTGAARKREGSVPLRSHACSFMVLLLVAAVVVAPAPASARQESPAALYEKSLRFFDEGELEASVVALKAALEEDPGMLPGHVLMARIYLAISEPAAAEEALLRARRLGADSDIIWPLQAESMFLSAQYEKLLAQAPRDGLSDGPLAEVLLFRGRALIELGRHADATAHFQRAAELAPGAPQPYVFLAVSALRAGAVGRAESYAREATRIAPGDPDAWNAVGDVAHARNRFDDAIAAYSRALESAPGHLEARVSRAWLLIEQQRFEAAGRDVEELRERSPLAPRPAYLEALLLGRQGQQVRAREALRRASTLVAELGGTALENSPQLVLLAGVANFELGEFERARRHLVRYVDRFPEQPGPRKRLGAILLRDARTAEALRMLEPALQQAPDDPELLELLAQAYAERGRYDIARGYLTRAVELTDGSAHLRAKLAMARIGEGFEEEGIAVLEALFREDPSANAGSGEVLVSLLLERGEWDRAVSVAQVLRSQGPDNASYLNLLGKAQFGAGRVDEARETFLAALAANPTHVPSRLSLAILEARDGSEAEARRLLRRIIDENPGHDEAMVELAALERRSGSPEEALRWLERAQVGSGNPQRAALELVDLHLARGEPEQAMDVATGLLARSPESMDALAAVAKVYLAQGRRDLALDTYQRMSLIAGADGRKLMQVSRLQASAEARGDAIFSLHKAVQAEPGNLRARLRLVSLLVREKRLPEARDHVVVLLELAPQDERVHRMAGDLASSENDLATASKHFEIAWNLKASSMNLLRLFRALAATGRGEEGVELLRGWSATHPEDLEVRRALADAYLAQGKLDQARRAHEEALTLSPQDPGLLTNMARILDAKGLPQALEYAERALAVAPRNPDVLDTVGWLLVRRGEAAKGLGYLRDAHSRASSNPEIRYHVAAALVALDRKDEARRELRIALRSPHPFVGERQAEALLKELEE